MTNQSPHSDWRLTGSRAKYAAVAVGLVVASQLVAAVTTLASALALGTVSIISVVLLLAATEASYGVFGYLTNSYARRPMERVSFSIPAGRAILAAVAAAVALYLFRTGVLTVATDIGLRPTALTTVDVSTEQLSALLFWFVPLSLFVIGPAEELFFRGLLHPYLREAFSLAGVFALTSLLFTVWHLGGLIQLGGTAALVTTVVYLVVNVVFAGVYEYTGSLTAAAISHGVYDAIIAGIVAVRL